MTKGRIKRLLSNLKAAWKLDVQDVVRENEAYRAYLSDQKDQVEEAMRDLGGNLLPEICQYTDKVESYWSNAKWAEGKGGKDYLSEAWTPKSFANHNRWYNKIGQTQGGYAGDLVRVWKYLKSLYYRRGPIQNVVNNKAMLTGTPQVKFDDNDPAQEKWKLIAKANKMPWRWGHIIQNTYLWNDYFTIINRKNSNNTEIPADRGTRMVRHVEPMNMEDPTVDKTDPEKVIAWRIRNTESSLDPADVIHHRLNYLGNDTRGVPTFNGCLESIAYLYECVRDLYYLVHVRARLPMAINVKGGQSAVDAEKNRWQQLPGVGRFMVKNDGTKVDYPPAYQGVSESNTPIAVFLQDIAIANNLPLFLVTSDYTNNSLASTLSADSPVTRLIEHNRVQFEDQFRPIVIALVGDSCPPFSFDWPPVIERNIKEMAEAYEIGINAGAVSSETMSTEVFDQDWDVEKPRIDKEREDATRSWGLMKNMNAKGPKEPEMEPDA